MCLPREEQPNHTKRSKKSNTHTNAKEKKKDWMECSTLGSTPTTTCIQFLGIE